MTNSTAAIATTGAPPRKRLWQHLYVQVLCAIAVGVVVGYFWPNVGAALKPLGDAFIKLIKMIIAPIIFCTVVHGIAGMKDMRKVGRVGLKALIYFEVVTSLALLVGLIVVNLWQPGAGMNVDPAAIDTKGIEAFTSEAAKQNVADYLLHIIPPPWSARSRKATSSRSCSSPSCSPSPST